MKKETAKERSERDRTEGEVEREERYLLGNILNNILYGKRSCIGQECVHHFKTGSLRVANCTNSSNSRECKAGRESCHVNAAMAPDLSHHRATKT